MPLISYISIPHKTLNGDYKYIRLDLNRYNEEEYLFNLKNFKLNNLQKYIYENYMKFYKFIGIYYDEWFNDIQYKKTRIKVTDKCQYLYHIFYESTNYFHVVREKFKVD